MQTEQRSYVQEKYLEYGFDCSWQKRVIYWLAHMLVAQAAAVGCRRHAASAGMINNLIARSTEGQIVLTLELRLTNSLQLQTHPTHPSPKNQLKSPCFCINTLLIVCGVKNQLLEQRHHSSEALENTPPTIR
eukprot:1039547-Amphidinium_carterae.1